MEPEPKFTWDDIEDLRRSCGLVEDDCPSEAFPVIEYARRMGLNASTALNQIRRMMAAGKLKSGQATRADARGHRGITTVYWPA